MRSSATSTTQASACGWSPPCGDPLCNTGSQNTAHQVTGPLFFLMKTMKCLILTHLGTLVSPTLEPLQFAQRPNIGVEDAIIYQYHKTGAAVGETGGCWSDILLPGSSTTSLTTLSTCGCMAISQRSQSTASGPPFLFNVCTSDFNSRSSMMTWPLCAVCLEGTNWSTGRSSWTGMRTSTCV